jgi:hypothetical protein
VANTRITPDVLKVPLAILNLPVVGLYMPEQK